ncbi:hypothetical protein L195_g012141 [Trifolium pratense]|uniref:Copia protein n=1 Tax=Trifolium pratense TaxID=57577 RepID=A0A2K3PJK2_TRIPR|nr:hypothetical protein L195_g012141 [Trifolium pratense]
MHGRSKHIDVRFHFLRDLTKDGAIELVHCRSEEQLADLLTKPLKLESFCKLREGLGMCDDWLACNKILAGTKPSQARPAGLQEAHTPWPALPTGLPSQLAGLCYKLLGPDNPEFGCEGTSLAMPSAYHPQSDGQA